MSVRERLPDYHLNIECGGEGVANRNTHDNNAKLEGQWVVGKRPMFLSATGSYYTTFPLSHPWALAASRLLTNPGAVTSHSLS